MKDTLLEEAYQVDLEDAVERYSDMVYRISKTITKNESDAQDVFQETYLRLVRYRETIQSEEHLKAWLIRVASNCAKTVVTDSWNKRTQGIDETLVVEQTFETKEQGLLFKRIRELPPDQALALYLFYYEEYTIQEIGNIMKKNINTVKSYLRRGKARLRKHLEEDGVSI